MNALVGESATRRSGVGAVGTILAVCVVHADLEMPAKVNRVGRTAIDKRPVAGRIAVRALGLDGDHVCDPVNHGGVHQAVYAYDEQDAQRWGAKSRRSLDPGWFGENLRISGLAVSDSVIGERWRVGDTALEVSAPRVPCATFQYWSTERQWVKRFTQQSDTGAYLRVLTEGTIGAGDEVRVEYVPDHGVTVRDLFTGRDPERLEQLLAVEPTVSGDVRMQVERHARRANRVRPDNQEGAAVSGPSTVSERASEPSTVSERASEPSTQRPSHSTGPGEARS